MSPREYGTLLFRSIDREAGCECVGWRGGAGGVTSHMSCAVCCYKLQEVCRLCGRSAAPFDRSVLGRHQGVRPANCLIETLLHPSGRDTRGGKGRSEVRHSLEGADARPHPDTTQRIQSVRIKISPLAAGEAGGVGRGE